jgi:hypothetical protein
VLVRNAMTSSLKISARDDHSKALTRYLDFLYSSCGRARIYTLATISPVRSLICRVS